MSEEREQILDMLEAGSITAEEANDLLGAIEAGGESEAEDGPTAAEWKSEGEPPTQLWLAPTLSGLILAAAGGVTLVKVAGRSRLARLGAGLLFSFGALLALFGLWSRNAVWLLVRVEENGKIEANVRVPLPLGMARRAVQLAAQQIGDDERAAYLESATAFLEGFERGKREPMTIEVDEGSGRLVRVYIG